MIGFFTPICRFASFPFAKHCVARQFKIVGGKTSPCHSGERYCSLFYLISANSLAYLMDYAELCDGFLHTDNYSLHIDTNYS